MKFPQPLARAHLIRRYKRFLADVRLEDGSEVTAHVANSGAMLGTAEPGMVVWLSKSDNPKRKLAWSWELVEVDGHLVGVNTAHPNLIVADAILGGLIPELAGYDGLRREVRYGVNSRIDILLESPDRPPCWVEVKNVHLKRGDWAEFPDAVTARGAKHLAEMTAQVAKGDRAVMVYLVQRQDCVGFRPAADIDPAYAKALQDATAKGVEAVCYTCRMGLDAIGLGEPLPMDICGQSRQIDGTES
jgi:sugar fermentation stimulation protein A